jgi:hypothetical protein
MPVRILGIQDVSIHGWDDVRCMTTSCLPTDIPTTIPTKIPMPSSFPTDPRLRKTTYDVFVRGSSWRWPLRGRQTHSIPKRLRRKKKPSVRLQMEVENNGKAKLWAYLFPLAVSLFKVGCRIESSLRLCQLRKIMGSCCLKELPSITAPTYAALLSAVDGILAINLDSNSYPIGVDCHASRTPLTCLKI